MRKVSLTFLTLSFIVMSMQAQVAGSLKLGGSSYQGDLHCRTDNNIRLFDEVNPSFGLGLRFPFSDVVGLRTEGTLIRLSGKESNFENAGHTNRGWEFENNFLELSALLDWELLGKRRFTEGGKFKRTLTPVIFGGLGLAFNNPKVDFNNSTVPNIDEDKENSDKLKLAIPVGLGLKYYISDGFALGLEGGIRLPISDYYDGVSLTAGPDVNDAYGFGGIKAYFDLAKKDEDGDGIVDKKDACPSVPGIEAFSGCPDTDSDGVQDKEDTCPTVAGLVALKGCPDADSDGIADKDDTCPNIAGLASMNGCPDADADGITDADDSCPEVAGLASMMGCPDSDSDGIADKDDSCPEVAGIPSKNGCPFVDTDTDGIEDELDDCPELAGTAATKGCPDGDSDGVADKDDKCPSIAGTTADGCPPIPVTATPAFRDEVNMKMINASRNITFGTSSSRLDAQDKTYIDEVIAILNQYPEYNARVNGYTDDIGSERINQRLSSRRAKAVKEYMVSQGIDPARLDYRGLGEADPISTNNSAEGRKSNRRVEIVLDNGFGSPGGTTVKGGIPNLELSRPGDCNCGNSGNPVFNVPKISFTPRSLTRLGTNPEFGNAHDLDATGFYNRLKTAHQNSARDRQFLDDLFRAMGYSGFSDASPDMFYETMVPNGVSGNMGYGKNHNTTSVTLDAYSEADLQAFRVRSANGCDIHFMKTCGNHFYYCK